jgi:hypothetical protein
MTTVMTTLVIISLDPETLQECEPILTDEVQYIDDHIRFHVPEDDYAPSRVIPNELVVLVKELSIKQLNEAIKSL